MISSHWVLCWCCLSPCLPLVSEHKLSRWALPFLPHLGTLWPLDWQLPALCVLRPVLLPFVFQRARSTVFKGTHVKLPVPLDWLPSLCHPQGCPLPLTSASQSCGVLSGFVCLLLFLELAKPFLSYGILSTSASHI